MRLYIACIALLFSLAPIARADTVELKTGEKVEGVFKQAGPAGAVIEVGGQPITFAMDKVRAIYLGAVPVAQQVPSAYSDAFDALKGLQSVTTSNVSYRDYAPRVLDTKVKVDKYLASPGSGDDERRTSIRIAMQYYELAATAWNNRIIKSGRDADLGTLLRTDPVLRECQAVLSVIAEADASAERATQPTVIGRTKFPPIVRASGNQTLADAVQSFAIYSTGSRIGDNPNLLWSCATSKIAEVEKR